MSLAFNQITACLLTRKRTPDIDKIIHSLPGFAGILIYDGSVLGNEHRIFSRYECCEWAPTEHVYVQDDDVVMSQQGFLHMQEIYQPETLLVNMPTPHFKQYEQDDIRLVGFGAIFHKSLANIAFATYRKHFQFGELEFREADRIFTGLTPSVRTNVPFTHLDSAIAADRMYRQPDHNFCLTQIRDRINAVKIKETHRETS